LRMIRLKEQEEETLRLQRLKHSEAERLRREAIEEDRINRERQLRHKNEKDDLLQKLKRLRSEANSVEDQLKNLHYEPDPYDEAEEQESIRREREYLDEVERSRRPFKSLMIRASGTNKRISRSILKPRRGPNLLPLRATKTIKD